MFTIGLTGSIATGKSEAARLLAARGARVIDADLLVHAAYAPGSPGFDAVVAAFGPGVLGPDGAIDRARLGERVFQDPDAMRLLTGIVWPLARQQAEALKQQAAAEGVPILVIEAPLLLEAGWRDLVDEVWHVHASPEAARDRLMKQRALRHAETEARIAARQPSPAGPSDLVIENNGDLTALAALVEAAWLTLIARKLV